MLRDDQRRLADLAQGETLGLLGHGLFESFNRLLE
jgi:hypothetical protein